MVLGVKCHIATFLIPDSRMHPLIAKPLCQLTPPPCAHTHTILYPDQELITTLFLDSSMHPLIAALVLTLTTTMCLHTALLKPQCNAWVNIHSCRYWIILSERLLRQFVATPVLGRGARFVQWMQEAAAADPGPLMAFRLAM